MSAAAVVLALCLVASPSPLLLETAAAAATAATTCSSSTSSSACLSAIPSLNLIANAEELIPGRGGGGEAGVLRLRFSRPLAPTFYHLRVVDPNQGFPVVLADQRIYGGHRTEYEIVDFERWGPDSSLHIHLKDLTLNTTHCGILKPSLSLLSAWRNSSRRAITGIRFHGLGEDLVLNFRENVRGPRYLRVYRLSKGGTAPSAASFPVRVAAFRSFFGMETTWSVSTRSFGEGNRLGEEGERGGRSLPPLEVRLYDSDARSLLARWIDPFGSEAGAGAEADRKYEMDVGVLVGGQERPQVLHEDDRSTKNDTEFGATNARPPASEPQPPLGLPSSTPHTWTSSCSFFVDN